MLQSDTLYIVSSQACVRRLLLSNGSAAQVVWTSRDFFASLRVLGFASSQQVLCDHRASQLATTAAGFAGKRSPYRERTFDEVNLLQQLHAGNVTAQQLCEQLAPLSAAKRSSASCYRQAGLLSLLQRLARAERLLQQAGFCDADTAWWRCLQHLQKTAVLPAGLRKFTGIVFDGVVDLSPLQWQLVAQLARLGLPIQVRLPECQQLGLFATAIQHIYSDLRAQATAGKLHVRFVPVTGMRRAVLQLLSQAARLSCCDGATQEDACMQLQAAISPYQEAHWIAQRVVAWQREAGVPVRIAIAFHQITRQARALQHVLQEYGVRCVVACGLPLTQRLCMQLLLDLLRARQQGIPVHMVSALLAHPAYDKRIDAQQASLIQAMLMQTGVQCDAGVAQDSSGALLRYLNHFAKYQQQAAAGPMQMTPQQAQACLEPLLGVLYAIPLQGRLQDYLQHVLQLLQQHIVACPDGDHAQVLAFAEDLLRLWCALSQHAQAAAAAVWSLEDFIALLHAHAQRHHTSSHTVADSAVVEIVSMRQLWARQVDYVVLAGLSQQAAAGGRAGETLLQEQDVSTVNAALATGAGAFAGRKQQLADAAGFDALWFAGAVLAAQKAVLATTHLHDEQGKSTLPSTLFQRLCIACNKQLQQLGQQQTGQSQHAHAADGKPLSQLQRHHEAARHALQHSDLQHGQHVISPNSDNASVPCLSNKQHNQVCLFACMQQQRRAFFADEAAPSDFAFALGAHALQQRFDKLGLCADSPITPSRIEAVAHCPFRFFVERLLQVQLPQQALGLAGLQTGQLAHTVLQRYYEQHGRHSSTLHLNRVQEIVRRLVHTHSRPWIQQAYEHERPLWQGFCLWLHTALTQLIVRQAQQPPIQGVAPCHTELSIGLPHSALAAVPVQLGDRTIFLAGVLDRVDVGTGGCVVIDYKMGSQTQLTSKLSPSSLLQQHFQLPIYQRLLSHHLPQQTQGQLLGYLLSIRDGRPSVVLGSSRHQHWRERVQQDSRPDSLAAALTTLLQPIYDGHVAAHVGPACTHCRLQHVCRRPMTK